MSERGLWGRGPKATTSSPGQQLWCSNLCLASEPLLLAELLRYLPVLNCLPACSCSLTFYAYNGPYNVGGLRLVQTGDHDGDWEHITARWGRTLDIA